MSGGDKVQVIDVLRGMRARLDNGGWTQGISARNSDGRPVNTQSDSACQWCLTGAIWREVLDRGDDPNLNMRCAVQRAIRAHIPKIWDVGMLVGLQWWNDHDSRKARDVLDLLDRTIKAEEARA